MACLSRWIVGMFAAWLGIAPSLAAPPGRAAPAALRVEAFDVEQVASLAPGTTLQFSVFATPGAAATVLIEGVRRLVELREVEPGIYEGAHVIDAGDRLRAGSTAVATVWRDGAVARATLEESLLLDGAPPTPVASPAPAAAPSPAPAPRALPPEISVPERSLDAVPRRQHAAARGPDAASGRRPGHAPAGPGAAGAGACPCAVVVAAAAARLSLRRAAAGRPVVACRDCARVESIRAVEVPTGPAYAGAIAGGIAGAVFGEQIGKAHERHVTRALGAIGGAVLGHEIQRAATSRTLYDAALRMPNGALRVRRYDAPPPFQVGQLIRLDAASPRPARRPRSERRRSTFPAAETSTSLMQLATLATPARATPSRFAAIPSRLEALAVAGAIALLLPAFAQVADVRPGPRPPLHRGRLSHRGPARRRAARALPRAGGGGRRLRCASALCRLAPVGGARRSARSPGGDRRCRSGDRRPGLRRAAESRQRAARGAAPAAARRRRPARHRRRDGRDRGRPAALRRALPARRRRTRPARGRWRCAARWAEAALGARRTRPPAARAPTRVLLLAAALDGRTRHRRRSPAPRAAGRAARGAPPAMPAARRALAATAALMADARQSAVERAQERGDARAAADGRLAVGRRDGCSATRCCCASRRARRRRPSASPLRSPLWAAAAWLARVPWPLAGSARLRARRGIDAALRQRAGAVRAGARRRGAAGRWSSAASRRRDPVPTRACAAQAMSSRIGYAGPRARHRPRLAAAARPVGERRIPATATSRSTTRATCGSACWCSRCCCSCASRWRAALAWLLSVAGEARAPRGAAPRRWRRGGGSSLLATLAALVAFGLALSNLRQLTSELGRVWLIVGAAWFFFLRAGPLAERLARAAARRRLVPALRVAAAVRRRACWSRAMLRHARHGPAADRRLRRRARSSPRRSRCGGTSAAASASRRFALAVGAVRARGSAPSRCGAVRRLGSVDDVDRRAAREPGRAVRVDQRPARAGHLVPARGAGRGLRPRRGAVVRLRAGRRLQRRAGADPQRLHLHRDRRRVRRAGGVGRGARLRGLAAPADPPPRPRHARRAAPRGRAPASSATTARRCSAGSRVAWVVLTLVPARRHRRRQPRGAAAHRRDLSVRQLRHDLAAGQHGVPRAVPERRRAGAEPRDG